MAVDRGTFQRTIDACTTNAERLLEDAEWALHRESTGVALAMLAQEECAKAFLLALVRDGILPWTNEVRRSLSVHECKHLVTLIMEWLLEVNEARLDEVVDRLPARQEPKLPPDVAIAMNIYRHELIERVGKRYAERRSDWNGRARRWADGQRDRRKQAALYVRIGADGSLSSEPMESQESLEEELLRTRALLVFARDVDRNVIFAHHEYTTFSAIFGTMFRDHGPQGVPMAPEKRHDSGIPGVVVVERTIACANVVLPEPVDSPRASLKDQPAAPPLNSHDSGKP